MDPDSEYVSGSPTIYHLNSELTTGKLQDLKVFYDRLQSWAHNFLFLLSASAFSLFIVEAFPSYGIFYFLKYVRTHSNFCVSIVPSASFHTRTVLS